MCLLSAWVLGGCSLVQDPGMFVFVDDAGVDAAFRDAGEDGGFDAGMCAAAADCPSRSNAVVECQAGECVISGCAAGFDDCNDALEDGCEVNLATADAHCGRCNNPCDLDNAVASCDAGACRIDACIGGFDDCNRDRSDGCEADLSSPASCGECGVACIAPTVLCDVSRTPSTCVESCGAASELCGVSCVDVSTNVLHCTGCDLPCAVPEHATPTCDAGCGFDCVGDYEDCDGAAGCEVDLARDLNNCGGCGVRCEGMRATWTCASRACAVVACEGTYGDCNADPADGCEVDTSTSAAHCGGCDVVCDGTCRDGVCDPIVDVAGERTHTCAVNLSGEVRCWGYNRVGQLGTGDLGPRALPTRVLMADGTPLLARAVAAGFQHSCVIDLGGSLFCWGRGGYFELGNGSPAARTVPTPVTSAAPEFLARTFVAVESRESQTCAVDDLGGLWCWGRNGFGQTGTGTRTDTQQATRVAGLPGPVAQVGLGPVTTCALLRDGTVWCWGRNTVGQVGALEGTAVVLTPVDVGLTAIVSLGVASHACAADRAGRLFCWGFGLGGANGAADQTHRPTPTEVPTITGVLEVSAGSLFTCVVDGTGPACFGSRGEGALGDGSTVGFTTELVRPAGLGTASRIVPIHDGACAIDGASLRCWGQNQYGQLGRDETILATAPRAVLAAGGGPILDVTSLSVGDRHGCVISGGAAYCWGAGERGQLGTGAFRGTSSPAAVAGLVSPTHLAAGYLSSCAVVADTGVCWGDDNFERLGTAGATTATPEMIRVPGGSVTEVRLGLNHGCAIDGGAVQCWGSNTSGQLGRGGATGGTEDLPAPVVGLTDAVQIAPGSRFTCARRAGGTVQCWGVAGRLGDGTGAASTSPVTVADVSAAIALDAGKFHACAIAEGAVSGRGQVYCWGSNIAGAVGHPSVFSNFDAPYAVLGLTDAVSVAAGDDYSCAARGDGSVWCWGANSHGQLGDGTTTSRPTPAAVLAVSGATEVVLGPAEGSRLTCALQGGAGRVSCWGDCAVGACGTGEALIRPAPGLVVGL